MSRRPLDANTYAIPGAVVGARYAEELSYKNNIFLGTEKTIPSIFSTSADIISRHLGSMTNSQEEPKYMSETDIYYFGAGSLAVDIRNFRFQLAGRDNAMRSPIFDISKKNSSLTSQSENTVLGSTAISTLDGYIMHPLGKEFPSTPFTPVKGWMKQFFPGIDIQSITLLTIMELVQALLLKQLGDFISNASGTNIENVSSEKDLGTIVIENRDFFYNPSR